MPQLVLIIRSSDRRCSVRKGVLRNFAKFRGKHLCQSLVFNKVAGLRPATLLKKKLWYRCFPLNFAKFLRTPFLQNTSGRLLLDNLLYKDFLHLIQLRNAMFATLATSVLFKMKTSIKRKHYYTIKPKTSIESTLSPLAKPFEPALLNSALPPPQPTNNSPVPLIKPPL